MRAGAHHFALALGQRLAFLARQQAAELVGARQDRRAHLVEQVRAHFGAGVRPGRESGLRRGNRAYLPSFLSPPGTFATMSRGIGGIEAFGARARPRPIAHRCNGKAVLCRSCSGFHSGVQQAAARRDCASGRRCRTPRAAPGRRWSPCFPARRASRVDTRTMSPLLCVKPWPGAPRSTIGANIVPRNSAKPSGYVVLADGLADEFRGIAADLRHRALAFEPEAFLALDLELAPRPGARRRG